MRCHAVIVEAKCRSVLSAYLRRSAVKRSTMAAERLLHGSVQIGAKVAEIERKQTAAAIQFVIVSFVTRRADFSNPVLRLRTV